MKGCVDSNETATSASLGTFNDTQFNHGCHMAAPGADPGISEGGRFLPFPSSLLLSLSPLHPVALPLEVGPLKPARGTGGAL